ncbi:MAG: amylo-alpha-1,6-glucosidase, partial [Bacteroidales bacterium]|nr:amylo-alpha-1,6-glucosidase [Bacteroidales bacterium]
VNCNTRKYHGMLVVPQPKFGNDPHVLLSTIHETVIQHNAEFNLGIHKFQDNVYYPRGHKYVRDFKLDPNSCITWRVGGVVLEREMVFSSREDMLMLKYTLVEAHSETRLRFKPFLAFRNIHTLSKVNDDVNKSFRFVKNGAEFTMYDGYTPLVIQFTKEPFYTHAPDWYYNIEYTYEKIRAYDYLEDLYVPGVFELELKMGESIVIGVGTREILPAGLKQKFAAELNKRIPRDNFKNCLRNASEQFFVNREDKTDLMAGFPWFGLIGRDTFMALPGLLLTSGDTDTFAKVIDSMIRRMQGPFFPSAVLNQKIEYNSVDTQLWFFWALQKYNEYIGETKKNWAKYKHIISKILDAYADGTWFNIRMEENGLLFAGEHGYALTWMNAMIDGKPVTPRIGNPVEVNALWYNAVMFSLQMAQDAGDIEFFKKWKPVSIKISASFVDKFWDQKKGYLADFIHGEYKDWSVRPNMLLAVSMPFSALDDLQQKKVLDVVERELLTPRGLRTLSPKNVKYKGVYRGTFQQREEAYHQGSVMPWLVGHFAEAYLKVYGNSGLSVVKNLYNTFEPEMQEYGIGTISELFDGDPPHKPSGATSMATAVAELLRIDQMIINTNSL